jgi:hypothetical protein
MFFAPMTMVEVETAAAEEVELHAVLSSELVKQVRAVELGKLVSLIKTKMVHLKTHLVVLMFAGRIVVVTVQGALHPHHHLLISDLIFAVI